MGIKIYKDEEQKHWLTKAMWAKNNRAKNKILKKEAGFLTNLLFQLDDLVYVVDNHKLMWSKDPQHQIIPSEYLELKDRGISYQLSRINSNMFRDFFNFHVHQDALEPFYSLFLKEIKEKFIISDEFAFTYGKKETCVTLPEMGYYGIPEENLNRILIWLRDPKKKNQIVDFGYRVGDETSAKILIFRSGDKFALATLVEGHTKKN